MVGPQSLKEKLVHVELTGKKKKKAEIQSVDWFLSELLFEVWMNTAHLTYLDMKSPLLITGICIDHYEVLFFKQN